jgi:hypothetical protein
VPRSHFSHKSARGPRANSVSSPYSSSTPPLAGIRTHTVVVQALDALTHLDHRGAAAADPLTGDGVGITTQVRFRESPLTL